MGNPLLDRLSDLGVYIREDLLVYRGSWIKFVFFGILCLGLAFYVIWNALYWKWCDVGVYAVTIVFLGFGLGGTLFYNRLEKDELKAEKR